MISNCHKNIMGTISFDGKFGPMRKAQDFIVYPKQESGPFVIIQSDHRFGRLNLDTGELILSDNRKQYANSVWLQMCVMRRTEVRETVPADDLQTLRGWIKSSAGLEVGGCVVSDNTGAFEL